jgi:hypothetical protein
MMSAYTMVCRNGSVSRGVEGACSSVSRGVEGACSSVSRGVEGACSSWLD